MKNSTLATALSVLIGIGFHFAAVAETKPSPTENPQCADLLKQYEVLAKEADAVCEKDDEESQKQCAALDSKFEELEKALDAAECDGGDQAGGEADGQTVHP